MVMIVDSCICFASCGDDNDENKVPSYNSSSTSRKLWGGWYRPANNLSQVMLLFDNGKMYFYETNQNGSYDFTWNYNDNTGILATTVGEKQWTVTLTDSTAWTGIMLWGKKESMTFKRLDALSEARIVLDKRIWVNISNGTEWTPAFRNNKYYYMENGNSYINIIPGNAKVYESIAQDKIFIREFYSSKIIYECVIDHPYSYENVRVSCKWVSNYGDGGHKSDLYLRPKN